MHYMWLGVCVCVCVSQLLHLLQYLCAVVTQMEHLCLLMLDLTVVLLHQLSAHSTAPVTTQI